MSTSRIESLRDLDAWKIAMQLTVLVSGAAKQLPVDERFELSAQMRRAAVSIPANLAEGQACGEDGRYIHHLRTALGSQGELGTHIEIARRLAMLPELALGALEDQLTRSGQVLHGLVRSRLRKRRVTLEQRVARP